MNVFQDEVQTKRLLISGIMLMLAMLTGSVVLLVFQPFGAPQAQVLRAHLESAQEQIFAGGDIEFSVFMINPAGKVTNVSLEYRIVDAEGIVVARRTDDISIHEQASVGVQMKIPESTSRGTAVIKTGIRYENKFLMESLVFDII
ncbi:MAG: hypothetical protein HY363_02635 [Candidatus Aenigmarchaeota archaeon]|nr:hypothetical protein [Candidatus Aenigmarchaeota archaeon]